MNHLHPPFSLPVNHGRVKAVGSFEELVSTPFTDGVNALCWQRTLDGDFAEVVERLGVGDGITTVDAARLQALSLSDEGQKARAILLQDLELLHAHDLLPVLDCIDGYTRDTDGGPVPTDVYSFHADSATVPADTYLCTYHGRSSEGLRNEEAIRKVDVPETRAELLRLYGGEDDADFIEHLNDHFFDLHYAALPDARPYSFGIGNLWRIAIAYPGCPVPPCIHRAPETLPGDPTRLLLIS